MNDPLPYYFPPEYFVHDHVGKSGDLWSLGICIFQLLTGSLPFPGPFPQHHMSEQQAQQFFDVSTIPFADHFPPLARDLILRLLQFHPEARGTIADIKLHEYFATTNWRQVVLNAKENASTFYVPEYSTIPTFTFSKFFSMQSEWVRNALISVKPLPIEYQSMYSNWSLFSEVAQKEWKDMYRLMHPVVTEAKKSSASLTVSSFFSRLGLSKLSSGNTSKVTSISRAEFASRRRRSRFSIDDIME